MMEEVQSASSSQPQSTSKTRQERSVASNFKRQCLFFTTSLQECFRYVKAFFVGQGKKLTAKDEKEATEADLLTSKMQVDAAEDAENTKKQLNKSY